MMWWVIAGVSVVMLGYIVFAALVISGEYDDE